MTTKTRFDLEQDICSIHDCIEDLKRLQWKLLDGPAGSMTEDEVANYLLGIEYTLRLRNEKLWDTFCAVFEVDHYAPEYRGYNE